MASTNRTLVKCLTIPVLSAAALLVACNRDREPTAPADPAGGFQADLVPQNISYLTALFFANEPLIPDGSLTTDEPLPFGHTIHVVDHDNKDSWKIDGSAAVITFDDATCDPPEVPLPPGALHLMSPTGNEPTRLRSTRYHRTYLRDLTRLDYWACDVRPNVTQWPYIVLDIDWNGDNQIDDRIIFEPSHQNSLSPDPVCGAASNQPLPVLSMWQFWDGLRGTPGDPTTFRACWYSIHNPGVDQPLSVYIGENPNAAIVNLDGNHGGVQITHGVTAGGYDGWVDAFTIGKDINHTSGQTQNSTITYDFQKP